MFYHEGVPIRWRGFYSAETIILKWLKTYCIAHHFSLEVCGCARDNASKKSEENYFTSVLGESGWSFIPNEEDSLSSYMTVAQAQYAIFVDSTLGYESLARGKRTAGFSVRGTLMKMETRNFGWPAELQDRGPFWTNHAEESEFQRVMDYLTTVSDEEWEETRKKYVPDLMEYDPGNTKFLALMKQLEVPLKAEFT